MQAATKILGLALTGLVLLSGCAGEAEAEPATPTQTQSSTQTPTQEPTAEPVLIPAPLTGINYQEGTNSFLSRPAILAKIDNTTPGRPQLALNDADVVYVTRVEVGLTRLLAVFHSRLPEVIGPVRSVRPVDAPIIEPYGGVFVFSGGQATFTDDAYDTGLVMSNEDTEQGNDSYFREESRVAPWNLFFEPQKLQELYATEAAPAPSFEFDVIPSAVSGGVPISAVIVEYPQMTSRWDLDTARFPWSQAAEAAWYRTQDGSQHLQADGAQVVSKNVVILEVTHDLSFIDPKYGAIPKAELVNNSGVAHIFSEGYYIQGSWSKGLANEPILLFDPAGEPIKLAPGNTWIEMMDLPRSSFDVIP